MDLAEQVHIFGLSNIHTFAPNISLFSLTLNYAIPRIIILLQGVGSARDIFRGSGFILQMDNDII